MIHVWSFVNCLRERARLVKLSTLIPKILSRCLLIAASGPEVVERLIWSWIAWLAILDSFAVLNDLLARDPNISFFNNARANRQTGAQAHLHILVSVTTQSKTVPRSDYGPSFTGHGKLFGGGHRGLIAHSSERQPQETAKHLVKGGTRS